MRQPIRAVAIVIKETDILLMHRIEKGREYYVFPGGGVEDNETTEEAVLREIQEEASIKVDLKKLLYIHHIFSKQKKSDQFFYLCEYVSGTVKLGEFNESESMKSGDDFYEPVWFPLEKLPKTLIYPLEIVDWIMKDLKNNFANTPREASFKVSQFRQTL